MKKKNTLSKALLVTLSILSLAVSLGQSTLCAKAAQGNSYAFYYADPDTEPDDILN